ncbi:ATP-binding protein [Rhizobium sp. 18065]|uniref:ATP-binding protein n=1 Tax=Rhizobium sp. 18065 TaxID=2681411 RepID=UPI001FCE39A4|nr:ATP-binding protein [Rhizobium sp. 18065]
MPAQYPFIDVAVNDKIRPRLSRGEALMVFSPKLERVLWTNGAGARFFGSASIYDFLEEGPNRSDVTFRQIEAAARQLVKTGDSRSLMLRITSGFQKVPVTAVAELVEIRRGEPVVLVAIPPIGKPASLVDLAQELMAGFDDPDTHMAVFDGDGQVVASSGQFAALGITPHTARTLVKLTSGESDRLVKRPIPTGRGYLPAAIGKISDEPALHLLFAVETILGQMDPSADFAEPAAPAEVVQAEVVQAAVTQAAVVEETVVEHLTASEPAPAQPVVAVAPVEEPAIDEPVAPATVAIVEDMASEDMASDDVASDNVAEDEMAGTEVFEPVEATPLVDAEMPAEDLATDKGEETARAEAIEALPAATDTGGFASAPFDSVIAAIGTIEEIEVSAEDIAADALGSVESYGDELSGDDAAPAEATTADDGVGEVIGDAASDMPAEEIEAEGYAQAEAVVDDLGEGVAEDQAEPLTGDEAADMASETASDGGSDTEVRTEVDPADAPPVDLATEIAADDASREEAAFAEAVETAEHSGALASNDKVFVPSPADLPGEPIAAEPPLVDKTEPQAGVATEDTLASQDDPFVFSRERRAARFVWKIDAEGRFSEVSGEFAEAVGPHAADINGVAFSDLAALFNLDPDGKIGELLKKRDTWSGKTIYWPAEGTSLMVPVDLAALPTYTRNRDFDGFRGFGIVRVGDAVEDPNATGLTFVPQVPEAAVVADAPAVFASAAPETTVEEEEDEDEFRAYRFADETPEFLETQAEALDEAPAEFVEAEAADDAVEELAKAGEIDGDTPDDQNADDLPAGDTAHEAIEPETDVDVEDLTKPLSLIPSAPFRSVEPPVLRIMEPVRPVARPEKIVQLEEHRTRNRDGLSPGEQAAFREIGRKLDPMGLRAKVEESLSESLQAKTSGTAPEPDAAEVPAAATAEMPSRTVTTTPSSTPADQSDAPREERAQPAAPLLEGLPLKREKSLTAEIVDLMPVALLVHVGDRLIHANPEFFSLTGYASLDELEQSGGLDALIQRQDLDASGDQAGRVVAVRADDTLVPVTARLQSVRFDDASALMLALIVQPEAARPAPAQPEMTAAQAGEAARLRVEVEEMRSILETATDGVVILDADGDIRSMNRAASALFNFDDLETRGKPFVMLFAHESQKSILDYLSGLAGHGVASVLNDGREVIGREASGGFLPLFMTIGKLTSSNGFCVVIRDITQWKRTEEELRNAKRAAETANAHKTDFLARVSHEIRTPLNAIIGFADMMANEHFGPVGHPRYGEYAHDIVRSGRHVLDIVNDLLDISKIEAGEMDLDFAAVGLNETVQAAVSIIQPQANSQRVIIRTALSQAVPSVVADSRSIKQIVLNILANAIRFTPSGGQIIVSTAYEANGSVALRIRDTGIGMSRTELEQAMKPFRQVSTGSPRNRGDGTGLGLPLTKAMVDANRASFAISSAPNEGTLVEVSFPSPRVLAD